jgi:hypothetical protein
MVARVGYSIFLFFLFSAICVISLVYGSPLMAFFFDARAFPVDADKDGGDDYILVQFDVDLDEDVTSSVTVIANLYDTSNRVVSTEQISYGVTGFEEGYTSLRLTPNPDIAGTYYVHLALSGPSDELYIRDIQYNPEPGSEPVAYFADIMGFSDMDTIELELDVNIVQEMVSSVRVEASLASSAGDLISSRSLNYQTFFEEMDYKGLSFTPPGEDAYSLVLMVYPGDSGTATDSRLLQVLWPPGTGAYFKSYRAETFSDSIEVTFDVDLAYNVTYLVSVEAILYDSNSDVAGYGYTSYLTAGVSRDERTLELVPEQASADGYYAELVVYVEGYPADYGYIEEISCGWLPWDLNRDGIIDLTDLLILGSNFGKRASELNDPGLDINGDGIVDIIDLVIVSIHYGEKW